MKKKHPYHPYAYDVERADPCPEGGVTCPGWFPVPDHHPSCPGGGEICSRICPVEEQVECPCEGSGFMVPPIPANEVLENA